MVLEIPLRKSNLGQKNLLFMGPYISNKLSNDLKILNIATSFTHDYEKPVLMKLEWVNHYFNNNFYHYYHCYYYCYYFLSLFDFK